MRAKNLIFIAVLFLIIGGSIVYKESLNKGAEIEPQALAEASKLTDDEPTKEIELDINPMEEDEEDDIITSTLDGKIICIDPGHQKTGNNNHEPIGPGSSQTKPKVSSGTKGIATGKYEYELNLEVALLLKEALIEKGAIVHMVRESHDVDISNSQRAQLANDVNADLSLRIHADSAGTSSVSGYSILIPGGDFVPGDVISKSRDIAEYIDESLGKNISPPSRGLVVRDDLTGFNWTKVPAILIEMGFMSNPDEDQLMSTHEFQMNLVNGVIEGLEAYY